MPTQYKQMQEENKTNNVNIKRLKIEGENFYCISKIAGAAVFV